MPTSVLLAVLAAAGLLALAPALVRRYDATERLVAERALSSRRGCSTGAVAADRAGPPSGQSTLLVCPRGRANRWHALRRRLRWSVAGQWSAAGRFARWSRPHPVADPGRRVRRRRPARRRPMPTALHRRRRVLVALIGLNLVEVAGALLVGPGFWIGFTVSFSRAAGRTWSPPAPGGGHRSPAGVRAPPAGLDRGRTGGRPAAAGPPGGPAPSRGPAGGSRTGTQPPGRPAGRTWSITRYGIWAVDRGDLVRGWVGRPVTVVDGSGDVAQSGSAPRSHRGGQGFESPHLHTGFQSRALVVA